MEKMLVILGKIRFQRVFPFMATIQQTLQAKGGLIKAGDVAELLGLHVKYVYELARKGAIPSYQIGGALRFDRGELATWLNSKRKG
jgi:excisionase family DNA binding protein